MGKINLINKNGQSTAEYAILIGIIVAVAIAMQTYVKRGMQGRVYDASNKFYDNFTSDPNWATLSNTSVATLANKQFEPLNLSSKSTQNVTTDTETYSMEKGGAVTRASTRKTKQEAGDYQKQDYTQ